METVTKISIFDLDMTLMNTLSIEAKSIWEEKTGEKWKYKGFWSKKESLDDSIFDFQTIKPTEFAFRSELTKNNTKVFVVTGRLEHLRPEVQFILDKHDLKPHRLHLNNHSGQTLDFKLKLFGELVNEFPEVNEIEIWEDRIAHVDEFRTWGNSLGDKIKVTVNHVVI